MGLMFGVDLICRDSSGQTIASTIRSPKKQKPNKVFTVNRAGFKHKLTFHYRIKLVARHD